MLEEIELRHLRYFVAIAEEMNFTRAAKKLNIAQPPLSQQISKLEAKIGVKLFVRTKPQIQLTAAGKTLLGEAQLILAQVEKAVQNARQTGLGQIGSLIVGYVGSATFYVLPKILKAFWERYPQVKLELIELETDEQMAQLLGNRMDIGFLRPPINESGLNLKILMQEPMVLALPENHPMAVFSEIAIQDLKNEAFIMLPHRLAPTPYHQIIAMFQQAGYLPTVSQEALHIQTIINLVAARLGISLVPASVERIKRSDVIYRAIRPPVPVIEMAAAWNPHNFTPVINSFLTTIDEILPSLALPPSGSLAES
jgi:DNA-binding transcriptional LysR family regulator